MYEQRRAPLLPTRQFLRRLGNHVLVSQVLVVLSLGIGMMGYHAFEKLGWLDAFLNASMLLGGMGPVDTDLSPAGKLFAGCYALYAGLVFIAVSTILVAPVLHRLMHAFHLQTGKD